MGVCREEVGGGGGNERLFLRGDVVPMPLKPRKAHLRCLQASDTPDNSPKERILSKELCFPPPPLSSLLNDDVETEKE